MGNMINLTIENNYIQFGRGWDGGIKQSDVVSGSAYMHMFSSVQPVYVFWLVHLIRSYYDDYQYV